MDKQKIAEELVSVAKELTAARGISEDAALKKMDVMDRKLKKMYGSLENSYQRLREINKGLSVLKVAIQDSGAIERNSKTEKKLEDIYELTSEAMGRLNGAISSINVAVRR